MPALTPPSVSCERQTTATATGYPRISPVRARTVSRLLGTSDRVRAPRTPSTVTYWQSVEPTNTNIANGTAQSISCYTAITPSYPDQVPYYAVIESVGKDPSSGVTFVPSRTIEEIYTFHDTNLNVADGVIEDFDYSTDDLCMADLTAWPTQAAPEAGDEMGVELCATAGNPDQTLQYNQNFTLEFTSTVSSSTPLCLQSDTTADTIRWRTAPPLLPTRNSGVSTTPANTSRWVPTEARHHRTSASTR